MTARPNPNFVTERLRAMQREAQELQVHVDRHEQCRQLIRDLNVHATLRREHYGDDSTRCDGEAYIDVRVMSLIGPHRLDGFDADLLRRLVEHELRVHEQWFDAHGLDYAADQFLLAEESASEDAAVDG